MLTVFPDYQTDIVLAMILLKCNYECSIKCLSVVIANDLFNSVQL